jgi:hypothetical protein
MKQRTRWFLLAITAAALGVAACGKDLTDTTGTGSGGGTSSSGAMTTATTTGTSMSGGDCVLDQSHIDSCTLK